jgi:HAD superfamily hydrolase (TIGR01549 family)
MWGDGDGTGSEHARVETRIPNPVHRAACIRGVIFDVDGTLYNQALLRTVMAAELSVLPLTSPLGGWRRLRVLAAYRRAQERLRQRAAIGGDDQLAAAAREAAVPIDDVRQIVSEWMIDRPLKYLKLCRARGLLPLLNFLATAGVRLGVLSDYAPGDKLHALGLAGRFSPVLCSSDPEIAAFKPSPRGFLRACHVWRLDPAEVLAVGDRDDVDADGAAAAGMACVIIGRRRAARHPNGYAVFPSFERLHRVLASRR